MDPTREPNEYTGGEARAATTSTGNDIAADGLSRIPWQFVPKWSRDGAQSREIGGE
jgi:hypothetical protein